MIQINKTSEQNQRRSSHRAAKTVAMSALTTRKKGSKANTDVNTHADDNIISKKKETNSITSISPLHDIRNNFDINIDRSKTPINTKNKWITKARTSTVAEVTPPPHTIPSTIIKNSKRYTCVSKISSANSARRDSARKSKIRPAKTTIVRKSKIRSAKTTTKMLRNVETLMEKLPSSKPIILARIDLEDLKVNRRKKNSTAHSYTFGLRSIKIMTYSRDNPRNSNADSFPIKLYHMIQLATIECPLVCSWSQDGRSIAIDSKSVALSAILRRHFNRKHLISSIRHFASLTKLTAAGNTSLYISLFIQSIQLITDSRWLSFSRQLNNYGFTLKANTSPKVYFHPKFHRDVNDPYTLVKLLPYLPGKKKRDQLTSANILKEKAKAPNKSIQAPLQDPVKASKKASSVGKRKKDKKSAHPSVSVSSKVSTNTDLSRNGPVDRESNRPAENAATIPKVAATKSLSSRKKSLSSRKKNAGRKSNCTERSVKRRKNKVLPMAAKMSQPSKISRTNTMTPSDKVVYTKGHKVTPATKSEDGNGKHISKVSMEDAHTKVTRKSGTICHSAKSSLGKQDFLTKNNFFKTPSPRHRTTGAKYMSSPPPLSRYLEPKHGTSRLQLEPRLDEQDTKVSAQSSVKESPLPSSLMTVNFVTTPSPLSNNEPTPRTNNLSSTFAASSSASGNWSQSSDGVRMLSWVAEALESPSFQNDKDIDQNEDHPNHMASSARLYSPISRTCETLVHPAEMIQKRSSSDADYSCNANYPPSICLGLGAISNDGGNGPSPLSLRDPQDTQVELDMLRNCLEDIFGTGTNGNQTNDGLSIII